MSIVELTNTWLKNITNISLVVDIIFCNCLLLTGSNIIVITSSSSFNTSFKPFPYFFVLNVLQLLCRFSWTAELIKSHFVLRMLSTAVGLCRRYMLVKQNTWLFSLFCGGVNLSARRGELDLNMKFHSLWAHKDCGKMLRLSKLDFTNCIWKALLKQPGEINLWLSVSLNPYCIVPDANFIFLCYT